MDADPVKILSSSPAFRGQSGFRRKFDALETDAGLELSFDYHHYRARYVLKGATLRELADVLDTLRSGLADAAQSNVASTRGRLKTEAITSAFLKAVKYWPSTNPSDLWWFLIYRAFMDPLNHPVQTAHTNLLQSWKRTSGWALEEIAVRHYGRYLAQHGVELCIPDQDKKERIRKNITEHANSHININTDKIDLALFGTIPGDEPVFFGVVHVKASFAERRTDDVPLSLLLKRYGYTTPLWTMDCKSAPSPEPINLGELGARTDRLSHKRREIEEEGYFTGCFSYNTNTIPSGEHLPPERRIYVCDFANPEDQFSQFILNRWNNFRRMLAAGYS